MPYRTADLPGVGGRIKRYNEDFLVEEVPLYPASGEGTHTYFVIEKQGLTTLAAIKQIAAALGRPHRDVGYAGMKDAHGITRQTLSIEHVEPERVRQISLNRVRVMSATRHTNKLRLGHLAGNRFDIRIRNLDMDSVPGAQEIFDHLRRTGVPNYFGPQRFGVRGDNGRIGRAILLDDFGEAIALILGRPGPVDHGEVRSARELFDAGQLREAMLAWPRGFPEQIRVAREMVRTQGDVRRAWRAVDHTLRKLYLSAFQSELFNEVLAARIGEIDRLETGDLAWKHGNGAVFRVEDATVEQPRCDAFEISPTGPLYGPRMTEPGGRPGQIELHVLADAGLTRDRVRAAYSMKLDGARRPLRVPLCDAAIETGADHRGPFLLLRFSLPPGAYATSVTREICKNDAPESATDDDRSGE
jgi:tRNA pseudouridine13 synthase